MLLRYKSSNAENAGAVAVVVFNEGQSGRTDIVEGMLEESEVIFR